MLATRYGVEAYELAKAGRFGRMTSLQGATVDSVPLSEVRGVKSVDAFYLDIARRFYT
jgi:6-phosphofructokinase